MPTFVCERCLVFVAVAKEAAAASRTTYIHTHTDHHYRVERTHRERGSRRGSCARESRATWGSVARAARRIAEQPTADGVVCAQLYRYRHARRGERAGSADSEARKSRRE